MACKLFDLDELQYRSQFWEKPPLDVIRKENRASYIQRKEAIDMYMEGAPVLEIEKATGIVRTMLPRLLSRCMTLREDGKEYGYVGLIPGLHLYNREESPGQFSRLLKEYSSLPEFIKGCWFGDKKYTQIRNMRVVDLHNAFLKECRRLGIQDYEYPFNTENKGYASLCRYINDLKAANTELQAKRELKDNAQKLLSTGFGKRYSTDPVAPFSVVQLDGHKLDIIHTVQLYNDDGTVRYVPGERIWVIAIIDVATRCILGYSMAEGRSYDQSDVLNAISNAMSPRQRMDFTVKGFHYPENGGYHSLAFPELGNAMFDTIMMDNAEAHLARDVVEKLTNRLKVAVDFGSVATPESRGIIERFFGTLEEDYFHLLPMTTGSNPRDPRRKDAEKNAIKYKFSYDHVVELLEVAFADYNNRPHSSLNGLSPLECMEKRVYEAGMEPYLATDEIIEEIAQLRWKTVTRVVRGKASSGRRPYISFLGVEYRGDELSASHILLGKKITLHYDPLDISTLKAYNDQGVFIGILHARGQYGLSSISVKSRQMIMKNVRQKKKEKSEFETPVTAMMQELNEAGKTSRKSASQANTLRRELKELSPAEQIEQNKNNIIEFSAPTTIPAELPADKDIKDLSAEERYEMFYNKKVGEK